MSLIYKRFYELKYLSREDSISKIEEEINKLPIVKGVIINPLNLRLIIELNEDIDCNKLKEKLEMAVLRYDEKAEIIEIIPFEYNMEVKNQIENTEQIENKGGFFKKKKRNLFKKVSNLNKINFFNKIIVFDEISKLKIFSILLNILLILYAILTENKNAFYIVTISYLIAEKKPLLASLSNLVKNKELEEKIIILFVHIVLLITGYNLYATIIVLLFQLSEIYIRNNINQTFNSIITSLLNLNYNSNYNLVNENETTAVDIKHIKNKDIVILKSEDVIPIDGLVIDGEAKVDTSAISGDNTEITIKQRDTVLAGWKIKAGLLEVRVFNKTDETIIKKALDHLRITVKNTINTSYTLNLKNKYIIFVFCTFATFLLYIANLMEKSGPTIIFKISIVSFLATPFYMLKTISLMRSLGIFFAFKKGIIIKNDKLLDELYKIGTLIFRKSNVLTVGVKEVSKVVSYGYISEELLLEYATYAELNSEDVISRAIIEAFKKICPTAIIDKSRVTSFEKFPGMGVKIYLGDRYILVGNHYLMEKYNVNYEQISEVGTLLYVAVNKNNIGYILIDDKLKEEAPNAIYSLKNSGVKNTILITGDNYYYANYLGQVLNIENVYSEVLPEDKYKVIDIVKKTLRYGKKLAIVESTNSLYEVATVDVRILFYKHNTGYNFQNSDDDVIIMTMDPTKVSEAIQISKIIKKYINQTLLLNIIYKTVISTIFLWIYTNYWIIVIGDVIIALLILKRITKKFYETLINLYN